MPRIMEMKEIGGELWAKLDITKEQSPVHLYTDAEATALQNTMPDWQPIDTAPKDGTWILLSGGKVGTHWDDMAEGVPHPPMVIGRWHKDGDWDLGEWVFDNWDSAFRSSYDDPTKWLPLPRSI